MSTGVLLYCFDTPDVNYHKLAERCVEQIKKFLKLEMSSSKKALKLEPTLVLIELLWDQQ